MIPRPPISTLFPYTTLFRSLRNHRPHRSLCLPLPPGEGGRSRGERKSTRLNSSHQNTSYAGCCLKKTSPGGRGRQKPWRSEENTSELQSTDHLICRLLL